jgi:DNA gyrase/topoisomerase IV subunit A
VGHDNNCRANINYLLKFRREDLKALQDSGRLSRTLKMEERQSENFTVLDENGDLKIFENATEIIKYFVNFRLKYYVKRKAYLIETLEQELLLLSNKALFIKMIIDGKLKINNVPRKEIILALEVANFDQINGSYQYLLALPIHSLTKETYEALISEEISKEQELNILKQKDTTQVYRDDLQELRKALIKSY